MVGRNRSALQTIDAGGGMAQEKDTFTLKLTPEQQQQIQNATGKLTDTLEFSIMELEERINPGFRFT
jgi:hypothetical protein